MTLQSLYPWAKAAHVVAVILFVGGALATGMVLTLLPRMGEAASATAQAVRRWDQRLTTPAMLATWALGLMLASSGGWFTQTWLQIKMVAVLLISGVHGVQSGRLRRAVTRGETPRWNGVVLIIALVTLIATLAVLKPA